MFTVSFYKFFSFFNIGFCGTWNGWNLPQGSVEVSPSVGLDVGTTNSAVAVRRADGRFVVIPPPGPNGTNRGSSFAAESWKKKKIKHDMVMYINRLGLFWHVLHIKKEEEKKEIIHTWLPCKTMQNTCNKRKQQTKPTIWFPDLGRAHSCLVC